MAKGCIVIGTEGQGIDGIVKHGENGFLCKARDLDGLAELIKHIINLSQPRLQQISSKAIATAMELTDKKVAEHYINAILNI
jgi:glycosyltransferase involved in cell wall biosynthesis